MRNRIFALFAALVFVLAIAQTLVYWSNLGSAHGELDEDSLTIGDFPYDSFEGWPTGTPDYITDRFDEIFGDGGSWDDDIMDMIKDALLGMIESKPDYAHNEGQIVIGPDREGLFDNGALESDQILIYVDEDPDTGERNVMIVHIQPEGGTTIRNENELLTALEGVHTHVNILSSYYVPTNNYHPRSAPIEYNGQFFYVYQTTWNSYPQAGSQNWYLISDSHLYQNIAHWRGHIVRFNGEFWFANENTWSAPPAWGWLRIPEYLVGQTHATGGSLQTWQSNQNWVVYTMENNVPRFWRSVNGNNNIAPSEASCMSGHWTELINGWNTGWQSDMVNHYRVHNTYAPGDVVIYGVDARLRMRYYRVRNDIDSTVLQNGRLPAGEEYKPLVTDAFSKPQLNSDYWEPF